jgi:hypothetical protein
VTQSGFQASTKLVRNPVISRNDPLPARALYLLVGVAMIGVGLYGRFKGIGTWPLGVDEFYISRSIDNVLRTGLPAFTCGGYYTRGLVFQYLVAGIRLLGSSPEFAGRLLAGLSSLMVLPAAFLVAKRMEGSLAGWLTAIILSVSVWEIEMARFGRMYAPFQAVFAWYLVCYLRYTVDKDDRALKWMIGLSILGVLTWEGGVLLGVANVLAVVWAQEHGRLRSADWRRLFGLIALLVALYLATRDLRGFAEPPGTAAGGASDAPGNMQSIASWAVGLKQHPAWVVGLLPPLCLAAASLSFIWAYRRRWLMATGLTAALAAAALHLFLVSIGILALMLLMRLVSYRELTGKRGRYFILALLGFLAFWLAFDHWMGSRTDHAPESLRVVHDLFGLPDLYDVVIRPWGRTLPLLSVALALALIFWAFSVLNADTENRTPDPAAVLLSILVALVLAVGASATERMETRYTFFLYPLLIALAVSAVLRLMRGSTANRRVPVVLMAAVPLLCFGATEDFQPWHIVRVDSAEVNFRVGMSPSRAAHYYPRNDMRLVARWLDAHITANDVVISVVPNLDQYYHGFNYFFLDDDDPRYETYVCRDGLTERWTNHPVLYGEDSLKPIVVSGRRVLVVVWPDREARLQTFAAKEGWSSTRLWAAEHGDTDILLIASNSRAPRAP